MFKTSKPVDIVLPVHNEGASIEATLREFYEVVTKKNSIPIRFVICEDGSKDNTVEVLRRLEKELPMLLITSTERKGYSKAVIDGFRACTGDVVGFIDSDGQCDPSDFTKLYEKLDQYDFVLGYRNPRSDHWIRLVMSGSFKLVYKVIFPVKAKDPSCPYLLIKLPLLQRVLSGNVGILKQGFWWEFLARVTATKTAYAQVPVNHRVRSAGETQVYRPTKVPRIAYEHLLGLLSLKSELRSKQ